MQPPNAALRRSTEHLTSGRKPLFAARLIDMAIRVSNVNSGYTAVLHQ
jgi:hypothetical protein